MLLPFRPLPSGCLPREPGHLAPDFSFDPARSGTPADDMRNGARIDAQLIGHSALNAPVEPEASDRWNRHRDILFGNRSHVVGLLQATLVQALLVDVKRKMPPSLDKNRHGSFGSRLKEFRRCVGWTNQQPLAKAFKCGQQNVSLIENDEQEATLEQLAELVRLAGNENAEEFRAFFAGELLRRLSLRIEDLRPAWREQERQARRRA